MKKWQSILLQYLSPLVNKQLETELQVPTAHNGEYDVVIQVITPKVLQGKKNNAAFVYAYHFSDPTPMTKEEQEMCYMQREIYKYAKAIFLEANSS